MIDFDKEDLLFLSPLAGYTDLPFREVVKKFGADVTVSEMISSNALVYNSAKTLKMLEKSSDEVPFIVQIAGNNEKIIKEAVLILNDIPGIDGIDLNCGCPVPKVVRQGSGSALLKDLPKMSKIIETIKKNSNKRYTSVKARLGFDSKIAKEIAITCENSGADFLTLHARTRSDGYKSNKIDYNEIKKAKEVLNIPLVANGNVTGIFRKHLHVYSKNFADATAFRDKVNRVEDPLVLKQYIKSFFIS